MKVDLTAPTAALPRAGKRRLLVTPGRILALILVCSIAAVIAMSNPLLSLLCGIFFAMTTLTFALAQRLGSEINVSGLVVKK